MTSPATQPSLWRHSSFLAFWFTRIFSIIAYQIQVVAVGWQVYELTHNPWDLGMVGLVQFLPALLLALIAGQVADRYDRRILVYIAQALYALLVLILAVGSWQHWLTRDGIFVIACLIGVVRAFEFPAASAMLPSLVPSALLVPAISLTSSARQASFILGPALGGFLYVLGADVTYALAGLLFVLSAICAWLIDHHFTPNRKEPVSWQTMMAGITFIKQKPVLLGAISLDLFAVLLGGATALLPIYASEILLTGPWGLGLLRAAPAVGALMMSLYIARFPINKKAGKVMFAAVAVFGLATIVFALSKSLVLSVAALWLSGAADMISVVIRSSLEQLETPSDMRGRVGAVNWLFIGTSNQLGEFESGATASWVGTVPSVVLGGVGTLLVVGLWMKLFPALVHRDKLIE